MSKLQKLYDIIRLTKEVGKPLPADYLQEIEELEQDIIKNDVLPVISEKIEPLLSQIQRELVLVVDYIPGESISVRLSRKRSITQQLDTIEIVPDPQVSHNMGNIRRSSSPKSAKTNLRVTFPDGKIIENRFAYETLQDVVMYAGIDKVRSLNIIQCGVPLVSTTQDNFYNQKEISKGIYLITHSSTGQKRQQIEKISKELNLQLKVEIV